MPGPRWSPQYWRRSHLSSSPVSSSPALHEGSAFELLAAEDRRAAEAGLVTELVGDTEQLVVLRDPIAARRRARLDLARVRCDGEVGDEAVFALARAVR